MRRLGHDATDGGRASPPSVSVRLPIGYGRENRHRYPTAEDHRVVRHTLATGVVVCIDCPLRALNLPNGIAVRAVYMWTPVIAVPKYARRFVDPCLMAVLEDANRRNAERLCWRTGFYPVLVERIRAGDGWDGFVLEGDALDRAPFFLARMARLAIADAARQIRDQSGDPTAGLNTADAPVLVEHHRGSLL